VRAGVGKKWEIASWRSGAQSGAESAYYLQQESAKKPILLASATQLQQDLNICLHFLRWIKIACIIEY